MSHLAAQGKLGRQEVRHRSTIKQKKRIWSTFKIKDHLQTICFAWAMLTVWFWDIFIYLSIAHGKSSLITCLANILKLHLKKFPNHYTQQAVGQCISWNPGITTLLTHRLSIQLCWLQRSFQRKCKNVLGHKGQEDNFSLF